MTPDAERRIARIRSSSVPRAVPATGCDRHFTLRDRPQHRIMIDDPVADDVDDLALLLEPTAHPDHRGRHDLAPEDVEAMPLAIPVSSSIVRSEEHTSELQSLMRISYAVSRL